MSDGVWFVYFSMASFGLPLVVGWLRQRESDRATQLLVAWFGWLLLENAAAYLMRESTADGHNLIIGHLVLPVEATLVLLSLAEWQSTPLARTTVRFLVPLYLVLWVFAMIFVEQPHTNSVFASPTLAFLVLAASLFAFITRIQHSDRPLLETSWGWILPGLAMFYFSNVSGNIVLQILLLREQYGMMKRVLLLQMGVYLIATLVISWGIYWPTRTKPSGAYS